MPTKPVTSDFASLQKYQISDQRYLTNRREFANNLGLPKLFEYIDHFGLYAGTQTITQKLFCYELIKKSLDIPGHIAEFGVWKGSNLLFMAKVLQAMQPQSHKLVLGFDNFSGLPMPVEKDGKFATTTTGQYLGDENIVREIIKLYELEDWVHLFVGNALTTIPEFEKNSPESLISLAYIDFDLYEPVKVALDFLSRRLAVGGIIAFDEAISRQWPGETIAMLEFLNARGNGDYVMKANTISRQPTMYLIRER